MYQVPSYNRNSPIRKPHRNLLQILRRRKRANRKWLLPIIHNHTTQTRRNPRLLNRFIQRPDLQDRPSTTRISRARFLGDGDEPAGALDLVHVGDGGTGVIGGGGGGGLPGPGGGGGLALPGGQEEAGRGRGQGREVGWG